MTNRIKFSLLLCPCLALFACDQVDDFADLDEAEALAEIAEIAELGEWPVRTASPQPSAAVAGLDIAPSSAAIPEQTSACGITNKAKSPHAEHLIGWVRWAMSQPQDGPIADLTGEDCAMGQSGPYWYLAGTFGGAVTRECDMPAGKKIVLPLVNQWWIAAPEYYPDEESVAAVIPYFLDSWAEARANTCSLTLRIDGHDVRDSIEDYDDDFYLVVDEPFEVDVAWELDWTVGGLMPSIGAGYYAVINPLPPGDHVIELGGEICGDSPFSTSATYQLHVGP
ncbi:hypothetical protein G6O69_04995 [Pseudenhygromyxa sp. WMMC2535]|uniref:hypothetical protein n=1 Tax=Pseudenhygromyxa sp. WMMC2535 TaxID=2712867 RepID=UPI0015569414|nr:hypothetical protein [Pseudenhygromyxa sp. WMMC2535]NVB37177.1 hypothetical protein [Pseudenhygromyxa sp. WMMC2535]